MYKLLMILEFITNSKVAVILLALYVIFLLVAIFDTENSKLDRGIAIMALSGGVGVFTVVRLFLVGLKSTQIIVLVLMSVVFYFGFLVVKSSIIFKKRHVHHH